MEKQTQGLQLPGLTKAGEMGKDLCVCVCVGVPGGRSVGGSDPGFRPHWLCVPEQACLSSSGSLVVTGAEAAGLVLRAILL